MITAQALYGCFNSTGGREAVLQNCCLHYAAKWETHHLHWSIDRNCKMCEQFNVGRKRKHVVVVRLACIPPTEAFMAPEAANRCACTRVCDIEMPVQAQFIPTKRLLHNTVKVNETLSNYLPRLCQSCKFNLPRASNFPPEDVSISHSRGCAVVLLERLLPQHLAHPSAQCLDLQPQIPDDSPWF